jgi:hypothetical protein
MLFAVDVAGAMATIRTKPLVAEADSMHESPEAGPETTVADPELSLKSKESTTFVKEKLSAPDGTTYMPKPAATKKTAKSTRRMA